MSNFFAALDDSDNEGKNPAPAVAKKKAPKKTVVEPSKVEKRANKGDRNTKGGRSSRPPARDGKRTFDRKSGTGRGKEMKKGGGGGHNWGSDQNDAKKAEGPVTEGNEEANTPEEKEATNGEEKEKVVVEEPEPEPEEVTISYDDYIASKAQPDTAAFKALEVRDVENEFAGKAASSKAQDETFMQMGGKKGPRKKGSGKKEKETLILDFKVKKPAGGEERGRRDSDGAGRGGRCGGRGGRCGDRRREGGRGGRSNNGGGRGSGGGRGGGSKGLDTTDSGAFPSL